MIDSNNAKPGSGISLTLIESDATSHELAELLGGEVIMFDQMRECRKWNAAVSLQPKHKTKPFYREFEKRRF